MKALLCCLLLLASASALGKPVSTVELGPGEVATVRTALGHSTLIDIGRRPRAVVVGDQDAFRVEYVGNRIAIKPLVEGVRTNLFISTAYEDFQVVLAVGAVEQADFLVRLSRRGPEAAMQVHEPPPRCAPIDARGGLQVAVHTLRRVGRLIEAKFSVRASQPVTFEPEQIAVVAGKRDVVIETLQLERLAVDWQPTLGAVTFSMDGLNRKARVILRFSTPTSKVPLEVPLRWTDHECLKA